MYGYIYIYREEKNVDNYNNACTEVSTILNFLDREEYKKISQDMIEAIERNKNTEYEFKFDINIPLQEQILLKETKAILFNLFRDYLATPEQKQKIIKMQNEERAKIELKKKQMYNSEIFPNEESRMEEKRREIDEDEIKEKEESSLELVEYKPSFINKVWSYIQRLLKRFNL